MKWESLKLGRAEEKFMRRKSFEVGLEGRKGFTWFRHCSHFCQVCRTGFSKTANHKSRNGTPKMEESRTPGVEVAPVVEDRCGGATWGVGF